MGLMLANVEFRVWACGSCNPGSLFGGALTEYSVLTWPNHKQHWEAIR